MNVCTGSTIEIGPKLLGFVVDVLGVHWSSLNEPDLSRLVLKEGVFAESFKRVYAALRVQ